MENVTKKNWMKFGLDAEMLRLIYDLDQVYSGAVSVWLKAFILLKQAGGEMKRADLLRHLVGHNIGRKKVCEVLLMTGDFMFDDALGVVRLTEQAVSKMARGLGKNSLANAFAQENFPKQTPSNAHAAIEKENREEEGRPTGACTREWPSMPQEMERYAGEPWFGHMAWFFSPQEAQRWREAVMQQTYDKQLVGLMERHWGLTMLQFALHLVTWPSQRGTLTLGDVKCRFSRFLKAGRRPAMELKAKLLMADGQQTGDKAGNFYAWMDKHCRSLLMVERPLDYASFCELSEAYGREAVAQVLLDMENEPGLEMRDCGMTAERWLEARKHR